MVKKVIAIVSLIALFTVAIVQAIEKEQQDRLPGLKIGTEAPDFTLKNLDGEEVSLSDYRGKKVMLNFWATWCAPCEAEMPEMQKYYEKNKDQNIEILAVNMDPLNDVAGFVERYGLTFPVLLDPIVKNKVEVNELYKTVVIPTSYIIDEKGKIVNKYMSTMDLSVIEELMGE